MSSGVKIIKRNHAGGSKTAPFNHIEKSAQQNERDIAGTVKNWIVELAQRRLADEHRARAQFFAPIHP